MKPTTLMVSMLVAGALAGAAPQIPLVLKQAFSSGAIATVGSADQRSGATVQVGWPSGAKPLVLRREAKSYVAYVPLQNTSQQEEQCVRIDVHAQSSEGDELAVVVTPDRAFAIKPSSAVVQRVDITPSNSTSKGVPGPATGFLRIYAAASKPADANACSFAGTPKPSDVEIRIPEQPAMTWVFVGTLCTAVLVVLVTAYSLHRNEIGLFHVMGSANWAFERSWGANATLGGALLMTLLGLTMFPDRPHLITKASYSLLQILFAALVSLAPLVYNLIRREVQVNSGGVPKVEVQGFVIMFLIAGGLVLWAALGQVTTLSMVTEELISSGALEDSAGRALQGLSVLLFSLLLVYGFRSLYLTARAGSAAPRTIGGTMPGPQPAAAVAGLPAPMTEWSIL